MSVMRFEAAIEAAVAAGESVRGRTGDNPPVGAALANNSGELMGVGSTQPAGGAHAEVQALNRAGDARGATAVVTLEPCNHTGRTGPCAEALIDAGVTRVIYLTKDPNPVAAGGAQRLREAGVETIYLRREVPALRAWLHGVRTGRPHVTVKIAASLDGFSAAVDGTSQWITSAASRRHVHRDRAHRDAIIVGTQTAITDNPSLTARTARGELADHQPRRVVIGTRSLEGAAENLHRLGYEHYSSIPEALQALYAQGARDVLIEGGPTLIASFFEHDLVDALRIYTAPILLGEGRSIIGRALAETLSDAPRFTRTETTQLGDDIVTDYVRKA